MARYNTALQTAQTSGATTVASPSTGLTTTLTGSAPYTVTLATPSQFLGESQTFWNNTSGLVTLATPAGAFVGPGSSNSGTQVIPPNSTITLKSDGTNYIIVSEDGGPLVATTASISGITNLTATTGTHNIASTDQASSTGTGALTIAGGLGVAKKIYAAEYVGPVTGAVTGNVTGNITSSGTSSFTGTLQSSTTTTITGTFTYGGSTVHNYTTAPFLGTNSVIRTNANTISENIVIPSGTNGVSAGPITIASGYTVTVTGDWSVV